MLTKQIKVSNQTSTQYFEANPNARTNIEWNFSNSESSMTERYIKFNITTITAIPNLSNSGLLPSNQEPLKTL